MRPLGRLLLDDWRRKLMALALGFALWLWVGELIAVEQTYNLRVVTTSAPLALEPGTLQIRVPEDWRLVSIEGLETFADTAPVRLRGSQARIEDFLANGFAAALDPELDRLPDLQDKDDVRVQPSALRWGRPEDAVRMLVPDEQSPLLIFRFERVLVTDVLLGAHLLEILGEPAAGHVLLADEISFQPSQVRLEGPATAVSELIAGITQAERSYEAWRTGSDSAVRKEDTVFPLLDALQISDQNRNDISVRLGLAQRHLDRGITIAGETVSVRAPVRLTIPDPRPFNPDPDFLQVIPDPERAWTAPDWVPSPIRYLLSSRPDINEEWLDRHLMMFLPLNLIPDSALEQADYELDIEWTLVGLDPATKAEVLRRLSVNFEDPSKRTVAVQRAR